MQILLRFALLLWIMAPLLALGCPARIPAEDSAVIDKVLPYVKCIGDATAGGVVQFDIGRLHGGHGVVVIRRPLGGVPSEPRLYWVKDDTVYAVNKAAAACAPELPDAPEEITVGNVLAVAK